jgi:hypothetical protein
MKQTVTQYSCDGCGKFMGVVEADGDDLPIGFFGGEVTWVHLGGGAGTGSWTACGEDCISLAVTDSIHRVAWTEQHGPEQD